MPPTSSKKRSAEIEPGILSIFRLFTGVMFVLLALGAPTTLQEAYPNTFNLAMTVLMAALTVYLAVPPLRRLLRAGYLPIALTAAVVIPILLDALANAVILWGDAPNALLLEGSSRLFFWLIPPLLIISIQYRMRTMFSFTLLAALLPLFLNGATGMKGEAFEAQSTNAGVRLLLFGFVGYILVRIMTAQRQQRHAMAEQSAILAQKNAQLADYANTLEQLTIARERNRIARELHDTLAHTLSAVNVQLGALDVLIGRDPTAAHTLLNQIQVNARGGMDEARRALHALRASPIEAWGLDGALQRLAEKTGESNGLRATAEISPALPALSAPIEAHLYRIAEESINNVVRHARARHVQMGLQIKGDCLLLTITDDGIGFDAAAPTPDGHFGIVGMYERALLIDAALTVDSQPGTGTTVRFEMPLEKTR